MYLCRKRLEKINRIFVNYKKSYFALFPDYTDHC